MDALDRSSALQPLLLLFPMEAFRFVSGRLAGCFLVLTIGCAAVPMDAADPAPSEFGADVQLAPFTVGGKPLSISIHARTKGDRRYAESFADEVVEVAYAATDGATGRGLVIVGSKGEPHPILLLRKFHALAESGQLDPSVADAAAQITQSTEKLEVKFKGQGEGGDGPPMSFDTIVPALPIPLMGSASKLYQLAWAEGFDDARIERRLKGLTRADLDANELARYDWVFYLPPQNATAPVLKEVLNKAMAAQKMGVFKRTAVRGLVFTFKPLINKGVEAMRKGFLFMTILQAKDGWNEGDVDALTRAYVRVMMPNLKVDKGDERTRALAAIEKQKLANVEYAKDPFVTPTRLVNFDPTAFTSFEGDYSSRPPEVTHRFRREGEVFQWNFRQQPARRYYPAGDRLLVNEQGTVTIRFLVDDSGAVTGVEERWARHRQTIARQTQPAKGESVAR